MRAQIEALAGDPHVDTDEYCPDVVAPDFGREAELPCRIQDPDLWFAETPGGLETAKRWCEECPVRAACLAAAIARREPWGVWGGEIFERGTVITRKRPRGRPRKDDPYRNPLHPGRAA